MVDDIEKKIEIPVCKKCGTTVPPGKVLCWVCEHDPKLGRWDSPHGHGCDSDACENKPTAD